MDKVRYELMETPCHGEERDYIGYGIRCGDRVLPDLSLSREKVEKLVESCNQLQLSLIHLSDVVEDFLADI